jgi:hypothetical protein
LCARLRQSAFSSMTRKRNLRLRHHGVGITSRLRCTFIGWLRHFCSEWQWHWQWYRWHYWLKLQNTELTINCWPTVPVVHRFTGSPSGLWQTEAPHTNEDLSPLSFWWQDRENKLHPGANLKDLKHDTTDTGLMQCKRIWFRVCPPETKKWEWNSNVENTT